MRWKAPQDVSTIFLASGPLNVADGYVDAADDLGEGDLTGLRSNGFTLEPVEQPAADPATLSTSAPAAPPAPTPVEPVEPDQAAG